MADARAVLTGWARASYSTGKGRCAKKRGKEGRTEITMTGISQGHRRQMTAGRTHIWKKLSKNIKQYWTIT